MPTAEQISMDLVPMPEPVAESISTELAESALKYGRAARAPNTRKGYDGDVRRFGAWCQSQGLSPFPASPQTVTAFVAHLADLKKKPAYLKRLLTSISQQHKLQGLESPTAHAMVHEVLKGAINTLGSQQRRVQPLLPEDIKRAFERMDGSAVGRGEALRDVRDRSMILLGFAAGLRRSELVALDVDDITDVPEQGIMVYIGKSKTDQGGHGYLIPVAFGDHAATCPCRALRRWLDVSGVKEGAIYREITASGARTDQRASDAAVMRCVKRVARLAGLDPSKFSGHSLRAGLITAAKRAGKSNDDIMNVTRHTSEKMLRVYTRETDAFRSPPNRGIGL